MAQGTLKMWQLSTVQGSAGLAGHERHLSEEASGVLLVVVVRPVHHVRVFVNDDRDHHVDKDGEVERAGCLPDRVEVHVAERDKEDHLATLRLSRVGSAEQRQLRRISVPTVPCKMRSILYIRAAKSYELICLSQEAAAHHLVHDDSRRLAHLRVWRAVRVEPLRREGRLRARQGLYSARAAGARPGGVRRRSGAAPPCGRDRGVVGLRLRVVPDRVVRRCVACVRPAGGCRLSRGCEASDFT